jgi:hypothetical protein
MLDLRWGGGGTSLGMVTSQNSPSEVPQAKPDLSFLRRIGPDPHAGGAQTIALEKCPDIWELANGDFAVIGIDMTAGAIGSLPPTAGCGPDERIVRIPRNLLVNAKPEIPDHV